MPRLTAAVFLAIMFVSGCAQQKELPLTRTDLNPETDFRAFKTFRWFDGPFLPGDPATADKAQYTFIRDAVNASLQKQNYDWQQFMATDLVVHIHSGVYAAERISNWITYNWYETWWGAYADRVDVSRYAPGTLIIDVIHAKNTALVWRGLIPGVFSEEGSIIQRETLTQRIAAAVENIPAAIR